MPNDSTAHILIRAETPLWAASKRGDISPAVNVLNEGADLAIRNAPRQNH